MYAYSEGDQQCHQRILNRGILLTRQIIFLLPLILIIPLFMGIDGVMYAGPIADGAAALVAIIFAEREMKALQQGNVVLE